MKQIIVLSLSLLVWWGCGDAGVASEKVFDINEKRSQLQDKRAELNKLTAEIEQLEKEIEIMNPDVKSARRKLVTSGLVGREDFARYINIQGTVEADDLVEVSAELGGRIIRLHVKEGDNVRQGDLLVELDLEQLDKQIAEIEVSLDLAKTVYERQSRLWEQKIGSEMQFLQAENNLKRLEKNLEMLTFQRSKSKVYAPSSGVVERLILQIGEMTAPGTPILQLLDLNSLKVVANVPENYLSVVRKGAKVEVSIPALDRKAMAVVKMIGNTINPANRTFEVEATLENKDKMLKPNLLANMFIREYFSPNQLILPIELVQQEIDGREFVMVEEETTAGAVASKKYVETGLSYEGKIEILSGLQDNEKVIQEGARGLKDKEPITVIKAKTQENNG